MKRVTLGLAAEMVDRFNWFLKESDSGWMVALYGSTLTGSGRDLDLIAFNYLPHPKIESLCAAFKQVAGFELLEGAYKGIFADGYGFKSTVFDFILDVQVRIALPSMTDIHFYALEKTGRGL